MTWGVGVTRDRCVIQLDEQLGRDSGNNVIAFLEVFTVPLVFHTESVWTLHGLHRLFRLSTDSTWTLLRIFLAEHPANFKFLVLVQS